MSKASSKSTRNSFTKLHPQPSTVMEKVASKNSSLRLGDVAAVGNNFIGEGDEAPQEKAASMRKTKEVMHQSTRNSSTKSHPQPSTVKEKVASKSSSLRLGDVAVVGNNGSDEGAEAPELLSVCWE